MDEDGEPKTTFRDWFPKVWTKSHFNRKRGELTYKLDELSSIDLYNTNYLQLYICTFEKELKFDKKRNLVLDAEGNLQYGYHLIYTREILACRNPEDANYLLGG